MARNLNLKLVGSVEPLLAGRPCLHHTVFTVNSPKGGQRAVQAKKMLKGIEQVKRKNKYSTRDSLLNSTSLEEKPEKLKAEERYLAGGSKSIND